LLSKLGPEPLSDDFSVDYLMRRARQVRRNIKTFLMDADIVVGVGNIYAN
jgi:formamidopyrimidine-DNA glycosylase